MYIPKARPYHLRHAAVSLWLNAGAPVTQVADRAAHSVNVLLRVYASCSHLCVEPGRFPHRHPYRAVVGHQPDPAARRQKGP